MDTSAIHRLSSPMGSDNSDITLDSGLSNAESQTLVGDDQSEPPSSPTDSGYNDEYEVYVVQYHQAGSQMPEWAVAVRTWVTTENERREGSGNLYRLSECEGRYRCERLEGINYESRNGWCGSTMVSRISSENLEYVDWAIKDMEISETSNSEFDRRRWAFNIVQALGAHDLTTEGNVTTFEDLETRMNDLLRLHA